MPLFSILLLLQTYVQFHTLGIILHDFAFQSQEFCKSLFHFTSQHLIFYQALACGASIPSSNHTYDILKTVSLWHLIIVSAGHFQILRVSLKKLSVKNVFLTHLVLTIFCFATGLQPPILRSYFDLLLQEFSDEFGLSIPVSYRVLYSGCFCLLLFPQWIESWSLLLSWLCILLLVVFQGRPLFDQCFFIFLGLLPVVSLFSTPYPLSFLFNFTLSPLLSIVLFPASLVLILLPPLAPFFDVVLTHFLNILHQLVLWPPPPSAPPSQQALSLWPCWIYVFLLQAYVLFKRPRSPEGP